MLSAGTGLALVVLLTMRLSWEELGGVADASVRATCWTRGSCHCFV
jgi:hypothetical protein